MRWLDVAGPPGSGKSTICYPLWGDKEIVGDGLPPPEKWRPFINEILRLIDVIASKPAPYIPGLDRHLDLVTPAIRMNGRSLAKMTAVYLRNETKRGPFIQAGFIQRGLGFGWRLKALGEDIGQIRRFFELMPVSLGAVFLVASEKEIIRRNKERLNNQATAHEDRSYQVPLVQEAIMVAQQTLKCRVPLMLLDVERQSPDESRSALKAFAASCR